MRHMQLHFFFPNICIFIARVNKKKMRMEETIRSLREGAYKELEEKEQSLQKQVKMVQEELDQTQGKTTTFQGFHIGELCRRERKPPGGLKKNLGIRPE